MKIYVIKNKEGKYFRSVGYGGGGGNWREKLEDAKFYVKFGQAKGRVTWWFREYPDYGCPQIIAFELGENNQTVIDVEAETNKKIVKIAQEKLKKKIRYLQSDIDYQKNSQESLRNKIAGMEAQLKSL